MLSVLFSSLRFVYFSLFLCNDGQDYFLQPLCFAGFVDWPHCLPLVVLCLLKIVHVVLLVPASDNASSASC